MVAKKQVTDITERQTTPPWEVLYQSWADSLEHSLRQSEHLHASMWDSGHQELGRLRSQVDQNLQLFQNWSNRWQRQHSEMLRWLARLPAEGPQR